MPTAIAQNYRSESEALGKRAAQFKIDPTLIPMPTPGLLKALDMFSGAGGFSTGLMRWARDHGFKIDLTIINHWAEALERAKENLGNVTVFNASIQDLDPEDVVPGRYLDLLLASPECIYFSSARGAKPINDQRRSSAAEILRFLEKIYVETLVLENVCEIEKWGPLDDQNRPINARKGEYFKAFIKAIKRLGYNVSYQHVVAADHGDPTARKRFFLIAQKRQAVRFPIPLFSKNGSVPGTQPWVPARAIIDFAVKGLSIFARHVPHVVKTLRRITVGFEAQTERAPLARAYVEAVKRFAHVTQMYYAQIDPLPTKAKLGRKLTKDERDHVKRVKATAQAQHRLLVEETFSTPVAHFTWEELLLRDGVEPSLEGDQRLLMGTANIVNPVVTKLFGTANTTDIDEPLDTVKAGGSTYGLARPVPDSFVVTPNHAEKSPNEDRTAPLTDPLGTLTNKNQFGIVSAAVDPYLLRANTSDTSTWDDSITPIDTPMRTVVTKNNLSIIVPDATILPQHTYNRENVAAIDDTLPTVTTISRHGLAEAVINDVEPFIPSYYGPKGEHDRAPRTLHDPLATQPTANRFSYVEPTLVNMKGWSTATSVDQPTPTLTTTAGQLYVAEPFVCNRNSQTNDNHDRTHSLDEPIPTTTTRGAGYYVDPVLVSQHYGFDNANPSLDGPMVTAGTRGAGYIAQPTTAGPEPVIIPQHRGAPCDPLDRPLRAMVTGGGTGVATPSPSNDEIPALASSLHSAGLANVTPGKPYVIVSGQVLELDVLYRMLTVNELKRAHSFETDRDSYNFGNASTSAAVKMIGNAVAVRTATALIGAALEHRYLSECTAVA